MNVGRTILNVAAMLLLTVGVAYGQATVEVRQAELSVPFGSATGTIVMVADQLVFVDEDRKEASFAIARRDIAGLEQDGSMVTVTTTTPVRDRTGERTVLRLRVADAAPLMRWYRSAGAVAVAATAPMTVAPRAATEAASYQAKHDHRIGDCEGRLIITDDRLVYESVNNIDDSRQWIFADIKEVQQSGPYKLEIKPFLGNTYNLELIGSGLDSRQYRELVDKITAARVPR